MIIINNGNGENNDTVSEQDITLMAEIQESRPQLLRHLGYFIRDATDDQLEEVYQGMHPENPQERAATLQMVLESIYFEDIPNGHFLNVQPEFGGLLIQTLIDYRDQGALEEFIQELPPNPEGSE